MRTSGPDDLGKPYERGWPLWGFQAVCLCAFLLWLVVVVSTR